MASRAILSIGTTFGPAPAASAPSSSNKPAETSVQVPPPPPGGSKAKKGVSKGERPEVVNLEGEEGLKEDPAADLRRKRRKQAVKAKDDDLIDRAIGEDAAWEHEVNLLELAFPKGYDYRNTLDAGLTSTFVRVPLQTMLPDQLLGESWRLSCQSLVCLQEGERQSALDRVSKLEEDVKVLQTELKSCRSALELERKRAEVAKKKAEDLSASLRMSQFDLGAANETANYCVDFSAINLKSHWDPKGRRIYVPEGSPEADLGVAEELPQAEVVALEQ
ncbi:hypothetical protein PIB30_007728 [Stylosanthes scabra]|uniref:Uncharacterized protein n=1 Tax=Stylosanthes scabra TaxID=79078 RepID=A0ABU6Y169_9FABA|nr:hypothetical protein [Stylosanthes scabra]